VSWESKELLAESDPVVVADPEDPLPHDEVLHNVLLRRLQHWPFPGINYGGGPCGLARRRCVEGDRQYSRQQCAGCVGRSQLVISLLPEGQGCARQQGSIGRCAALV